MRQRTFFTTYASCARAPLEDCSGGQQLVTTRHSPAWLCYGFTGFNTLLPRPTEGRTHGYLGRQMGRPLSDNMATPQPPEFLDIRKVSLDISDTIPIRLNQVETAQSRTG